MNNISYSIIIPHHNTPELLNRCLDSILPRDDVQIIVVDDNSNEDKLPVIIREDVQVIYISKEESKGAGHARNVGIAQSKGKWLLFADSDDYYAEELLEVLDKYKESDIDVLYFNYIHVDYDGNSFPENQLQKYLSNFNCLKQEIVHIKYRNNTPWTKMVKRDYVLKHNMYFEEVPNGNDVLFSLFVASYTNKIAVTPECLYYYVKTQNSIGTKKQTVTEFQTRIDHIIKHAAFDKSIGLKPRISVYKFLRNIAGNDGRGMLFRLLPMTIFHYLSPSFRREWINLLKS